MVAFYKSLSYLFCNIIQHIMHHKLLLYFRLMNKFFLAVLFFMSVKSFSQKISGVVFDEQGAPLPFSSIIIKGTTKGVTANNQAEFVFNLSAGKYTLVCQHVGYEKQERIIELGKKDEQIIFILPLQRFQLKDIVIKSNGEDPAYEIIRQAIKKRSFYNTQVKAFECEAYIKGLVKLRTLPDKILGRKIPDEDRKDMRLDSSGKGIIFLSESITKVSFTQPDKMKMEVVSGRQSGSDGFGFSFPTFISLYQNNVTIFTSRINPRGFISPIAENALSHYRYKFLGSFFEDGVEINTIRVTPKSTYEPLFSGIINITENSWRIHSCDLLLTKKYQLEILDTLQLTQIHVPINNDVWRVKNQLVHFNFKQLGIDAVGNFVNVYSKYNLAPKFPKKYFDRVVIKYDTAVNKKTKNYWDSIRPVPLEPEEIKDYNIKDSLYKVEKDSSLTKRNVDSLNKKQGQIKLAQLFWSGVNRTHYSLTNMYSYHIDPVLKSLQYNTVEGLVVKLSADYKKYIKKWKTNLTVSPNFRYGFSNTHLNAWVNVVFRTRDAGVDAKLKRETWSFGGGKRVSQINKENNITPLGNSISTLLFGENNMKIYENAFGEISFSKRYESGWRFGINALYEDRIPMENSTDFIFIEKNRKKFTPNYLFRISPSQFLRHQAAELGLEVSVKPGQRYIQFPNNKFAIGSKYPTFTFNFKHGLKNILGSDVDFDKWKFTIDDDVNLKLKGAVKYKVSVAGFLNNQKVFIQDYEFFNGNESVVAKEYLNTFQLLDYYSAFTTASLYGILNFEHHLNGLITNKIPLFKQLNWNLLYGSNAFYVNKNNRYAEVFFGLENVFKVLRVDVVTGFKDKFKPSMQIRLGLGGILGTGINTNLPKGRTASL